MDRSNDWRKKPASLDELDVGNLEAWPSVVALGDLNAPLGVPTTCSTILSPKPVLSPARLEHLMDGRGYPIRVRLRDEFCPVHRPNPRVSIPGHLPERSVPSPASALLVVHEEEVLLASKIAVVYSRCSSSSRSWCLCSVLSQM